jgi:hypothetical protein
MKKKKLETNRKKSEMKWKTEQLFIFKKKLNI